MEKKATIKYLLSEKGRKKSLLAGGEGTEIQHVETDITPDVLEIASVDQKGYVEIDLTKPLTDKLGITNYSHSVTYSPYIYREAKTYDFDAPQTAEALVKFEKERRARVAALEESLQPELERAKAKSEAARAVHQAEKAEREAFQARIQAEREAAREAAEAERLAWIEANGSDYLQRAVWLGYNCQRQYVTERAEMEFPDFLVDFNRDADWKDRSCPSPEALDEVEDLIQAGHDAKVVWLTDVRRESDDDDDYYRDPFDAREALIVEGYLGKYNLIKY